MEILLQLQKIENKFIVLPCNKFNIHVKQPSIVCLTKQGMPGPSSDIISASVGEDISRGCVVFLREGKFIKASYDDVLLRDTPINYFAFVLNDGVANTSIQIKQFGIFTNIDWNLTIGANYYLGLNGSISETPPAQGLLLLIGNAISSTELLIGFGTPIWIGE